MILRSCTLADLRLLEKWDPCGEMWPGSKRAFLVKRLAAPEHRLYIGEHKGAPVAWGQIKIEKRGYTLAWFTAPRYRRRGFGLAMARLLAAMAGRPVRARINTSRPYSERLAIRLGMVTEGRLLDTGEKWWVLK